MAGTASSLVAQVMTAPLQIGFGAIHAVATGRKAVLDLTVHHLGDAYRRQVVLGRLRRAARDPRVVGVLFRIEGAPGGWASSQDLRAAITALREAGKGTYAFLESGGNAALWLATACDKVFVVPTGDVALLGIGVELTFFGAALEKLGIAPDFEAAGEFKSFGEPYTRSFASPSNQAAMRAIVEDLHRQMVDDIAEAREIDAEAVDAAMREAPLSAPDAREHGLVDRVAYIDEVEAWIKEQHGKGTRLVGFDGWSRRDAMLRWMRRLGMPGRSIAVVHLEGPIVMDDRSAAPMIRARKVMPELRKLRKNKNVAAVVLHVNSGGGSALASDLIWREVELLKRDKPVVASFEDVCASGGYYLSAPANEIIARPGTITGSIGVFGGKLVVGKALRKLGVHTQEVSAAPNATLFSPTHPFDDDQRARFRSSLQRFYDGFVQRVAAGRRSPESAVEPHCRGRVWTGEAAHDRGLVDRFGDLATAIHRARELAGVSPTAWRRTDHRVSTRVALGARLARSLRPSFTQALVPTSVLLGASLVASVVGSRVAGTLEVVLRYAGTPMAMMPFDLRLK